MTGSAEGRCCYCGRETGLNGCPCNASQQHRAFVASLQVGRSGPPSIGWLCIRCGRSYAPFVAGCETCNRQEAKQP